MSLLLRTIFLIGLFTVTRIVTAGSTEAALKLDIAAQPIGDALNEFARQSGLQVVIDPMEGKGITGASVVGRFTAQDALVKLLTNTGLRFQYLNARTVAIRRAQWVGTDGAGSTPVAIDADRNDALRLVQSAVADSFTEEARSEDRKEGAGAAAEAEKSKVQEIVVTAQKKEERLQDVPVPVTVIGAQALANSNQTRLQDYYTKVPGLNLTILGDVGGPQIAIRGITTGGYVNPTAGTVIDDIPFGVSTAIVSGGFTLTPDVDASELSRVEVLRGPQGTLYGASSMGGLVKYMTVAPSTDSVSGRVQFGTSGVTRSDEIGYSVRAALNVPVNDKLGLRISGSSRRDPGYIDNAQTGRRDVNNTASKSARFATLWRPNDDLSLNLSALYQHTQRDGSSDTHLPAPVGPVAGLGDLQQSALLETGWFDQEFQAYSATMKLQLGRAQLTSLSGYSIGKASDAVDVTQTYGPGAQQLFGAGGVADRPGTKLTKFSQELRLSAPLGDHVDSLLGAFYTHEKYATHLDYDVVNQIRNPTTGGPPGSVVGTYFHVEQAGSYTEYAAFANLTFKLTERFDVQVGARQSHNEITFTGTQTGLLLGTPSPTLFTPDTVSTDNAFTYLLTPRFKISPDLMLYARLASGYRPGGPNSFVVGTIVGVPIEYGHDTTQNYELGLKGAAFGGILSFDASVFYIDWKDVQLQLRDLLPSGVFQTYNLNAGAAKSAGVELALELRPTDGLNIALTGAYNNAELTDVPTNANLSARSGDRLPYSARRSGSLSVDQEFPLTANINGFAGASVSYVGDRRGRFFPTGIQGTFPSYTQLDLRGGARFDTWTLNAYVNNVTDKRGVLRAGRDAAFSYAHVVSYTLPRTFGLNISKDF